MVECVKEQTESNRVRAEEGRQAQNRAIDNMEKKD